jgi:flagellar biosynthetic protein FliP
MVGTSGDSPLESLALGNLGSTLRMGLAIGVLSLAPAILLMTTCYVRIIVVLGLLRQALGVQQFPPTQVLTALSLFLTALVMWPTWERCYREGIAPYASTTASRAPTESGLRQTLERTALPLREFMSGQIQTAGNAAAVDMLMSYQPGESTARTPAQFYDDVPLQVLLPAYVLSELRTAFVIGFQVYIPFVVVDLVVTSVLASLGLGALPPAAVSLPFKLLLFVMMDGWFLTVEMLLAGLTAA